MIDQKCHPPLSRLGTPRQFLHPAQHTSLRDVVTEHFQLSMNARCTPGRVLNNHAEDQLSQFSAHRSSSHTSPIPREPFPVQLEPRPMPENNGVRLNKDQGFSPTCPKATQNDPK